MRSEEKTVKIATLGREHEYLVPLINEIFERNGISFTIRDKFDRAYDGLFIGQKGLGDLYVFEMDVERAKFLLDEILTAQ